MNRAALVFAGWVASASIACGARTSIELASFDRGGAGGATATSATSSSSTSSSAASTSSSIASSSSGPPPMECTSDAQCDDGVDCTVDACEMPAGVCQHSPNDAACDDGKLCTVDACDPTQGCQHTVSNAPCDDGIDCTTDTCDAATDTCSNVPCDSMCDDGTLCDGIERCDAMTGCVSGPPACQLNLACSTDSCDEGTMTCSHDQSPSCASKLRLLVGDSSGNLLSVSPYGAPTTTIAPSNGTVYNDVAILNGRWFAIDANATLYELVPMTNKIKNLLATVDANSLGAGPDGFLYAASTDVFRIDPDKGIGMDLGSLPAGYSSSGDIAFLNGHMFISVDGPCGGALIQFDPATGQSTILGGDGLGCVYGLGVSGSTLFIVNCDGTTGTFDPTTGVVQVLSTPPNVSPYGADVLP